MARRAGIFPDTETPGSDRAEPGVHLSLCYFSFSIRSLYDM